MLFESKEVNLTHRFIQQLSDRAPRVISIFLDGLEILRIEDGERTIDVDVDPDQAHWLMTIHFDFDPKPEYVIQIA